MLAGVVGGSYDPTKDINQRFDFMQHSNVVMHLVCFEVVIQPEGEEYLICDPLFGLLGQDGQSDLTS